MIRSDRDGTHDKNIVKIVNKDQQVQRLTMHYSGWSLVSLESVNGWILSSELSTIAPISTDNSSIDKTLEDGKIHQQEVEKLKLKISTLLKNNDSLLAKNTQISTENTRLIAKNKLLNTSIETLNSDLKTLKVKNTQEKVLNPTLEKQVDNSKASQDAVIVEKKDSGVNISNIFAINWLYIITALLVILAAIALSFFNRNKRRHSDLNILRR